MDPERILDEHAGCEIKSGAKQQIRDLAVMLSQTIAI